MCARIASTTFALTDYASVCVQAHLALAVRDGRGLEVVAAVINFKVAFRALDEFAACLAMKAGFGLKGRPWS